MKSGTKVCIRTYPFSGEEDWSQTGVVCRARKYETPPEGWFIVRFDDSGGSLCVHTERLRVR